MKKSLLARAKQRLSKVFRPKHAPLTRLRKGLNRMSAGGHVVEERNTGLPIEFARRCRGRGAKGFPRLSRSKYGLNPMSWELNMTY
jgi:hypothetical protein